MRNREKAAVRGLLILLTILAVESISRAQTWQWGVRGGGSSDGRNASPLESVSDIATDRNGNTYITGTIEAGGAPTIGTSSNYFSVHGNKDIFVASFSCNGVYRWAKVIGGAGDDFAGKIGTDTLGHVYVIGKNTPQTTVGQEIKFGSDSTQALSNYKAIFLVQFDTSGRFKWLRQPTPDTTSFSGGFTYSQSYDLDVDQNGDAYWLVQLSGGLVSGGGGWNAGRYAAYILKYDAMGVMSDHITPQLDLTQSYVDNLRFSRSRSGFFIFSGNVNFTVPAPKIAGASITHVMFMAAFSSTGSYLWKKENNLTILQTRMFSKPSIDAAGNIYYSGDCVSGDIFNGYTFTNALTSIKYPVPFIGKMDSTGKHLWIRNADGRSGDVSNSIVLKTENEIWLSGSANSMYWTPSLYIQGPPTGAYPIYIARFNAAGSILSLDSANGGTGGRNIATCSALDPKGNLAIGGNFNLSLNIKPGTTLLNSGGASDLFVAKYGFACNCTTQPSSNFSSAITSGRTVRFTYSGSTTNVDSLVWTWGDGNRQTVKTGLTTALNYTYPTPGTYTACANVYGSCGTASFCKTTTVDNAATVTELGLPGNIKVYPNPADRYLMIEGAEGSNVALLNTLGQVVLQQSVTDANARIELSSLPASLYLLQIRDRGGQCGRDAGFEAVKRPSPDTAPDKEAAVSIRERFARLSRYSY